MSPSRSRGLKRRETKKSPTSTSSIITTAAALSPENFMEASLSSMMPAHLGDEAYVLDVQRRGGYEHLVVVGEAQPRDGERDYEPAREDAPGRESRACR